MMAVYSITCYFNTGFDSINIPDSPARLTAAISKPFPSNWLLQNLDLAKTRVNASWDSIKDCDYVQIGDSFYYVMGIAMLTEACAELSLKMDYITTAGGIYAVSITGGNCTRAHSASDELFANNLPEPWSPSTDLEIKGRENVVGRTSGISRTIISSTVNLSAGLEKIADEYVDSNGEVVCYVPSVPAITEQYSAECVCVLPGGAKSQYLPCTGLYRLDTVEEQVKILRALGLDNAITGSYALPSIWGVWQQSGAYGQVNGEFYNKRASSEYRYTTVSNNKVFSLFNYYQILSIASGDRKQFEAHELYGDDSAPLFYAFSDPAPNGMPYCQPANFSRRSTLPFENCIKGGNWLNSPIAYGNASGSLIQQTEFGRRKDLAEVQREYNAGYGTAKGLLGFVGEVLSGNIGGALMSGADVVNNQVQNMFAEQAQANEKAQFATSQSIRVPDVTFAYSPAVQGYVGNDFVIIHIGLAAADVARLDKFLTMFGYAQSKVLERSDFTNRRYFNYVEATGVSIKGNVGLRIREGIMQQLSNGVRVWHVMPDDSYYTNNPIG